MVTGQWIVKKKTPTTLKMFIAVVKETSAKGADRPVFEILSC